MSNDLRWKIPASSSHRILAVNLNPRNAVIGGIAIGELELALQINLNQSAHMSLLGLEKLLKVPPPGVLTVVELVQSVPKHVGDPVAGRIQHIEGRRYSHQFGIILGGLRNTEQSHLHIPMRESVLPLPSRQLR
jgi:hypothetical protein